MPTDHDNTRQVVLAARLFAALTAGFVAVGSVAIAAALAEAGPPPADRGAADRAAAASGPAVAPAPAPPTTATPPAAARPAAAAPGSVPADPSAPVVVEVELVEFAFAPRSVTVPAGRPVVLRVANTGAVDHELVIGDAHVQEEAEKAMASAAGHAGHGGGHGHQGDVPSILLGPGESGEVAATFTEPGRLLLGCHVPGHWAAGMRGTLTVTG